MSCNRLRTYINRLIYGPRPPPLNACQISGRIAAGAVGVVVAHHIGKIASFEYEHWWLRKVRKIPYPPHPSLSPCGCLGRGYIDGITQCDACHGGECNCWIVS